LQIVQTFKEHDVKYYHKSKSNKHKIICWLDS